MACEGLRGSMILVCEAASLGYPPLRASHVQLQEVDHVFMRPLTKAQYINFGFTSST